MSKLKQNYFRRMTTYGGTHILTIGTAKVWQWALAQMLIWRAFSEIDKVLGEFFSTWRSLDFTCCLVEVMSVTVALVLEFIIIWAEFRAILPGKWSAILRPGFQKVVYVCKRVHYWLKGLENRAGKTHGYECFCRSQHSSPLTFATSIGAFVIFSLALLGQKTEGKRTPIPGCEYPSILGQICVLVEGFKCIK